VIVLPDFLHRDAVVKAADAGLHIMVEKPFATSVADADAMVKAIDKGGVKCMVEFFNRWSAPFAKAKDLLQAGDLGELITFNIELNDAITVPTKMLAWSAKSSPAWFLMSHTADLASWITDQRPVSVYAKGVKKILARQCIDTYDLIEALVEYPNDVLGRFTNCWVLPNGLPLVYELKMRIVGSQAAVDIDTSDQELHVITPERVNHPVTGWGKIQGHYVGHPYAMLADFIDNIVDDTEPLVGPKAGWENTVFLAAVHQSASEGRAIKIQW
jgi:predicted dehydrogenase